MSDFDIVNYYRKHLGMKPRETATSTPIQQDQPVQQIQDTDPFSPKNYFQGDAYKTAEISDKVTMFNTWMDSKSDSYLTPEQKKDFQLAAKAKKDNIFGFNEDAFGMFGGSLESSGVLGGAKDLAVKTLGAAAGGLKMLAAATPDAMVKRAVDSAMGVQPSLSTTGVLDAAQAALESYKTGFSKTEDARAAARTQEADLKAGQRLSQSPNDLAAKYGITQEQLTAVGKNIIDKPLETVAEVAGSGGVAKLGANSGRFLITGALKAAGKELTESQLDKLGLALGATLGGAMGVGETRLSLYDKAYNDAKDSGVAEPQARKLAEISSSYAENYGKIAAGGALGVAAGGTGVLDTATNVAKKGVARKVGDIALDAAGEAAQGGYSVAAGGKGSADVGLIDPNTAYAGVGSAALYEGIAGGLGAAATTGVESGIDAIKRQSGDNVWTPAATDATDTPPQSKASDKDALINRISIARDANNENDLDDALSVAEDSGLFSEKELSDILKGKVEKAQDAIYGEWIPTETQQEANARLVAESKESGLSLPEITKKHAESYKAKTENGVGRDKFASSSLAVLQGDTGKLRYTEQQALDAGLNEIDSRIVAGDRQGLSERQYDKRSTALRKELDKVYKEKPVAPTQQAASEVAIEATAPVAQEAVDVNALTSFADTVGKVVDYQGVIGRVEQIGSDLFVTQKGQEPILIESALSGVSPRELGVRQPTPKQVRTYEYNETQFVSGNPSIQQISEPQSTTDVQTEQLAPIVQNQDATQTILKEIESFTTDEATLFQWLIDAIPAEYVKAGATPQEADAAFEYAVTLAVQNILNQDTLPAQDRKPSWKIVNTIFNGEANNHIQAAINRQLEDLLNEQLTTPNSTEVIAERPATQNVETGANDATSGQTTSPASPTTQTERIENAIQKQKTSSQVLPSTERKPEVNVGLRQDGEGNKVDQVTTNKGEAKPASKEKEVGKQLTLGTTPKTSEPITVKDGIVYQGEYPAQNFETGNDITVPKDATNEQIKQALKDAGAVSGKQKFFEQEIKASLDGQINIGLNANQLPVDTKTTTIAYSEVVGATSLSQDVIDDLNNNDLNGALVNLSKQTKSTNIKRVISSSLNMLKGVSTKVDNGLITGITGSIKRDGAVEISIFDATEETLMHEVAHAITLSVLDASKQDRTPNQQKAVDAFKAAYDMSLASDDLHDEYGLSDLNEFVAEFMSNQQFRSKLELLDKGIIKSILNHLRRMFGLSPIKSTVDSLDTLGAWLVAPASGIQDGTTAYKLDTKPQRSVAAKAGILTKIARTFADRAIEGKTQFDNEGDKSPELNKTNRTVLERYVLRDGKAAFHYDEIKRDTVDIIEDKIKRVANKLKVNSNELRGSVSQLAIAKRADFLIRAQTKDKQDAIALAQAADSSATALHRALKSKRKELTAIYSKITSAYDRAINDNKESSKTLMNLRLDEAAGIVADIEQAMEKSVGKGKLTASMRKTTSGYLARLDEMRTSRTTINMMEGAREFLSDMMEIADDGKTATSKNLKKAQDLLAKWEFAHANEHISEQAPDGTWYTVTANGEKLPNGMRRENVAEWLSDVESLPYFNEVESLWKDTLKAYQDITEYGIKEGAVSASDAKRMKEVDPYYVPFSGDASRADDESILISANRKIIDKMDGSTKYNHANDSFTNLIAQSAKMSKYIANQTLGESLHNAYLAGSKLIRRDHKQPQVKYAVNGKTYSYRGNTDEVVGMLSPAADKNDALNIFRAANTTWGQFVTRAVPVFAPINASKDLGTRSFNLRGRQDLIDKSGKRLSVNAMRARFVVNAFSPKNWHASARETLYEDASGEIADLKRFGGLTTFSNTLSTEKDIEKLFGNKLVGIPKKAINTLLKAVNLWNNVFEHAIVLASYKSMVDAGMDKEKAAFVTRDMMNFSQKGTSTDAARAFYVFFNPAAQDALQLSKTFYDPKKGVNYVAFAEFAGIVGMASFAYAMLAEADDDDEFGNKYIDLLRDNEVASSIPIPLGNGKFYKVPVPFGAIQSAWITGVSIARYMRGVTKAQDAAATISQSLVKSYMVTGEPQVKFSEDPFHWTAVALLPTLTKPVYYASSGKRFDGVEINGRLRSDKYKSDQGKFLTEDSYKTAAKNLREAIGIDVTPEQIKVIAEGYLSGAAGALLETVVGNKLENLQSKGKDTEGMFSQINRLLGTNRIVSRNSEDRYMQSVFSKGFYEEYKNKLKQYDTGKVKKRETINDKINRFAANGADSDELKLLQAGLEHESAVESEKRESGYADLQKAYAAGEDVTAELNDYYKSEIDLQREFIWKIK